MRLTKTTSHAIRILVECAMAKGRLLQTSAIADQLDMTTMNVLKLVHILSKAGLVESARGRNGGVRLTKPAGSIRIGAVVGRIEATEVGVECSNPHAVVSPLNSIFDDALEEFIRVLDQHTLADLAEARTDSHEAAAAYELATTQR